MRKTFVAMIVLTGLVLAGLALAASGAAETPKRPALATFDPVQVRGDLKVTLIEVSRSAYYTDQHVQPEFRKRLAGGTARYVVPALEIAFVVERIGKNSSKNRMGHDAGVQIFRDGRKIEEVDGSVPGGVSSFYEYEKCRGRYANRLPEVANADCAEVRHVVKVGVAVQDGDDVRIEIMAGFDGEKRIFSFDHVPVQ